MPSEIYKVFIPSAGLGNRLKGITKSFNKALVDINNKPCISYIIEKFPDNIEFVIAIGYESISLKEFLLSAYPKKKFKFVNVDKYSGSGSGLGLTLYSAKKYLNCPFIFCANDCIVIDTIPSLNQNWIGGSFVSNYGDYRSLDYDSNNQLKSILPKNYHKKSENICAYIGLSGIKDYKSFWKNADITNREFVDIGESFLINRMKQFKVINFQWFDTGTIERLSITRDYFEKNSNKKYSILEKENEKIFFVGSRVIKISKNQDFISNRIKRSKYLKGFVPKVVYEGKYVYAYKYIEGKTFSNSNHNKDFNNLLIHLDKFWKKTLLSKPEYSKFYSSCYSFYKVKTDERVKEFLKKNEILDSPTIINGIKTPKISVLLKKIDWKLLSMGIPVRFHGDLHFENIIHTIHDKFVFLDHRQSFENSLKIGDIYYDFAKLLHGMIISHDIIDNNYFEVSTNNFNTEVNFNFHIKYSNKNFDDIFLKWLVEKGYNLLKVKILTAIIFINISPLHHYPYNKLLFYLGKLMLYDYTSNKNSFVK